MTSLPSFRDFFLALWPQYKEHGPFPWQTMLAERVAEGQWPQAIDLPTAAGKTACIDAAIYALAAQADRALAERTAPRRIWFVVDRRIVVDDAFDRASAIASTLEDAKDGPLKVIALVPTKGKSKPEDNDPLVEAAVTRARSYQTDAGKRRIAVVVNRVNTARQIASALREKTGDTADVVLLTGRIRPYERDRLVERWQRHLRAGAPEEWEKPIILVSTQCIEVGADFSFDALVTEAASLDALRQRFGRLNRMGDPGAAPATILMRERDLKEAPPDPIYGGAIRACWELLSSKATGGEGEAKRIDFGFDALDETLSDVDDLAACLAPRPDAPILLPAHLDLLCQTAPAPAVEPDIGLYLHGKERGAPEARVVWRADLFPHKDPLWKETVWKETVALCPPANGEMLTVPLYRLRAWLSAGRQAGDDGASDVEGAPAPSGGEEGLEQRGRPFLLWRGRDGSRVYDRPQEVKPNDIVVVPADYEMADLGQAAPCEGFGAGGLDLSEVSRKASGKPPALRINAASLKPWEACVPIKALVDLAQEPERDRDALRQALVAVRDYRPMSDDGPKAAPDWLRDLIDEVRDGRMEEHPSGGVVMLARRGRSVPEPDLFADDDDLTSAIVVKAGEEVSLAHHTKLVERAVGKITSRCLPPDLLKAFLCSATWHDAGKLDERFQHMLRQGADLSGEPLAKSATMPTSPEQWEIMRAAADLPKGFRHEMLSLQLAEQGAGPGEGEEELVLHLIASHHGHARPFAPVVPDQKPPAVLGHHAGVAVALDAAERAQLSQPHAIASGVADRFWRLTRRYGWWGLAYLEAVLRLGDWYGSAVVVQEDSEQDPRLPASRVSTKAARAKAQSDPVVLTGLDGANPLGFLTALGTLAVLNQGICPQARLAWRRAGATWRPVLSDVGFESEDALCEAIDRALRGRDVTEEAERRRETAEQAFSATKKILKDAQDKIKRRGLRGRERKAAFSKEIGPLQQELIEKRIEWLDALKHATPRQELALGQHIDCTVEEYREHAATFRQSASIDARESVDLLAAFANDASLETSGRITATPFCFITGSGHQYFLDTVRQLMSKIEPERLPSALFEPWAYSDEKLSMRWDPVEDRRYALMDRDPTANDNKSRTVWMANLLAYRALSLFPSAPGRWGLRTAGWSGKGDLFTWPTWESPAAVDTIRSLILLPDLGAERPNRRDLKELGISALFRARRIKVGSGANYKLNFSPAQSV